MQLSFPSQEEAIAYCERLGYEYTVEKVLDKKPRSKSYGNNFSWNKRTRTSTKWFYCWSMARTVHFSSVYVNVAGSDSKPGIAQV